MPSTRPRLHVLFEHGPDLRPFSTAYIRLLRPLTHPAVRGNLDATFGRHDSGAAVDAVVVDRLWRPDVTADLAADLVARARQRGARVIHALDDNFADLAAEQPAWGTRGAIAAFHRLVRSADGLVVSTPALRDRLANLNPAIAIVPNALDERLLEPERVDPAMAVLAPRRRPGDDRVVIGYMGTFTHDADWRLVAPALREVCRRHPGRVAIQLVGVAGQSGTLAAAPDLPIEVIRLTPEQMAYPAFLPWFTQAVDWDIGIAPLCDSDFTRTKSDIKHLDYAAAGLAGVYSAVPAYAATVRDDETGLVVPNAPRAWVDALDALVGDPGRRARIGAAAQAYLRRERTLAVRGGDWVEAFTTLLGASGGARVHLAGELQAAAGPPSILDPLVVGPIVAAPVAAEGVNLSLTVDAATLPSDSERTPARDPGPGGSPAPRGPAPRPLRLAVLYEFGHGGEARPLASAHLRLIRPFHHPAAAGRVDATWSTHFDPRNVDAVVLDRLWRPDVTIDHVERLIEAVRDVGAGLIYALDDNLLDLPAERADWPTAAHLAVVRRLLAEADGVLASSDALARRIAPLARRVAVVPNALDERLLGRTGPAPLATPFGPRPLVIGYMGTATHDDDLRMVLPALAEVCRRHAGQVVVECVGVVRQRATRRHIEAAGIPLRFAAPHPAEAEYPLFMAWFTRHVQWDVAIAPLRDTPFRRCKSDVKLLDYSAIGAAGVYSRVAAYAGSARHGETGWLVDNTPAAWVEALETLIAGADLRRHLADGARRYLWAERTLAHRAADWPAAIDALLAPG